MMQKQGVMLHAYRKWITLYAGAKGKANQVRSRRWISEQKAWPAKLDAIVVEREVELSINDDTLNVGVDDKFNR